MQTNTARIDRVTALTLLITDVELGDDDTAPTGADVALGSSLETETVGSVILGATGIATVRTRFGAAIADTFKELGTFNVGTDLLDHIVFSDVVKPVGSELVVDVRYEVKNP